YELHIKGKNSILLKEREMMAHLPSRTKKHNLHSDEGTGMYLSILNCKNMKKNQLNCFLLKKKWIRTLLIMKLAVIILMLGFVQAHSAVYSQEKMSLSLHQVTLKKALRAIQKNTHYQLIYSDDILPVDKKVTISVKDIPPSRVLHKVLSGTGLEFKVLD